MSFLAIDIGNTRLKWALYAAPHPGAVLLDQGAVFLETIDELAEKDWKLPACPAQHAGLRGGRRHRAPPRRSTDGTVGPGTALGGAQRTRSGVINGYDHPSRLGADRWVALIGARWRVLAAAAAGRADRGRHWW
jgi:type III pantothenate kinase